MQTIIDHRVVGLVINDENTYRNYGRPYFYGEENNTCIHIQNKTCKWVEDEIKDLLDLNSHWTYDDVKKILAWKIGKICHRQCYDQSVHNRNIIYHQDWNGNNTVIYGVSEDLNPFIESLISGLERNNLREIARENPQCCLNMLKQYSEEIERLYSVYLVTLLFFLSGGESPIYDCYAAKALFLYHEQQTGERIKYEPLPNKYSRDFSVLCTDNNSIYKKYINLLNTYYGERWKEERDIDRSLWVLGHGIKQGIVF